MPKTLEVPWHLIQKKYQSGNFSCRELAEEYGINSATVQQHCTREGWNKERQEIVAKVSQKVVESLVDLKIKAIQEHEAKAFRVSDKLISGVESSYDAMPNGLLDPAMLNGLAQALKTSVATARLSLGAIDPGQRIDITTNGESLHNRSIELLNTCKKLVAEGKVDATTIDVEGIVKSLEEKPNAS